MTNGKFVISLDFELMWGVRDKRTINDYGKNISGVHNVIPELLKTFSKYQISATFSTVGFLFFQNKEALINSLPAEKPNYSDSNLSPYHNYLNQVGADAVNDPFHYAPSLINEIIKYPEHEIGTHTFSHYYCLEDGQSVQEFTEDIKSAIKTANKYNLETTSLVFPRNQFNETYLKACEKLGILCYRGNEYSWLYKAKNGEQESKLRRALRLLDAYINISGHNCYDKQFLKSNYPVNIPSSRFLRPYSKSLKFFENQRLNRILTGMTHAAKNNLMYHIWWHPHNFGVNQQENFLFLNKILEHYSKLQKTYNFQSITMSGLAKELIHE